MNIAEKRKHPRVKINRLISYVCLDEDGKPIKQFMGSAVDISQGGLQLETSQDIEPESAILLMTTDEQDRLIEIRGKVAHCRDTGFGKFIAGVNFQGTRDENIEFAKCIIRAHFYRKKSAEKKSFQSEDHSRSVG